MRLLPWLCALAPCLAILPAGLARQISVSELNYNPLNSADYEYIELINSGTTEFNLAGCRFTSSVTYTFGSLILQPGQRVVICPDRAKFTSVYGAIANLAPGNYSGKFSNGGEKVTFVTATGAELFSFTYDNGGDWPSRADGLGSSLESVDPNGDLNDPANWRSSTEYQGSPGRAGLGSQRTVVINEVLAHTDPPLEDAIELKNVTDQDIAISGWYLSNTRTSPKKYRFPANTVIPARGYRVVYQYQFNAVAPKVGDTPFGLSAAHGDETVLTSADANGNLLLWIDAVSFDASQNGFSFGRYPDGVGRLRTMSALTMGTTVRAGEAPERLVLFRQGNGASNATPRVGPVVFNRIQYQPAVGQDEFLELLNASDARVTLFDPLNPANTWQFNPGVGFVFPTGVVLEPGEKALVVPTAPEAFRTKYQLPVTTKVFGPFTNKLSDTGENVALFKPDPPQLPPQPDAGFVPFILVEEIEYLPTPPWPTQAAGGGPALLRRDPGTFADEATAWTVDTQPPAEAPDIQASLVNGLVRIAWAAQAGVALILEERTEAVSGNWKTVAVISAPSLDGTAFRDLPATGERRHFRLRLP